MTAVLRPVKSSPGPRLPGSRQDGAGPGFTRRQPASARACCWRSSSWPEAPTRALALLSCRVTPERSGERTYGAVPSTRVLLVAALQRTPYGPSARSHARNYGGHQNDTRPSRGTAADPGTTGETRHERHRTLSCPAIGRNRSGPGPYGRFRGQKVAGAPKVSGWGAVTPGTIKETALTGLIDTRALQHVSQRPPGRDRSARQPEVDHVVESFDSQHGACLGEQPDRWLNASGPPGRRPSFRRGTDAGPY